MRTLQRGFARQLSFRGNSVLRTHHVLSSDSQNNDPPAFPFPRQSRPRCQEPFRLQRGFRRAAARAKGRFQCQVWRDPLKPRVSAEWAATVNALADRVEFSGGLRLVHELEPIVRPRHWPGKRWASTPTLPCLASSGHGAGGGWRLVLWPKHDGEHSRLVGWISNRRVRRYSRFHGLDRRGRLYQGRRTGQKPHPALSRSTGRGLRGKMPVLGASAVHWRGSWQTGMSAPPLAAPCPGFWAEIEAVELCPRICHSPQPCVFYRQTGRHYRPRRLRRGPPGLR